MERDNLCPECNGSGNGERWSAVYNEWEWCECRACHGDGTIAAHPTEEDVSLARLIHHIMPGPYGPTKVYRDDLPGYDAWLDGLR